MIGDNQPQDVVVEQVGAETPQLAEPELGAEKAPQEAPRTYSQEEWSKRESAKDKEVAQIREQLAQINLQAEIARAQHADEVSRAKDQREVEEGTITQPEATQRGQARETQRKNELAIKRQADMISQMAQQTEQYGRVLAAQDFGKEYELTTEQVTELLSDRDIKTPGDMRAKAANLALEKVRGELKKSKEIPPKFDQGQSGGRETPEKSLKARYPTMYPKK